MGILIAVSIALAIICAVILFVRIGAREYDAQALQLQELNAQGISVAKERALRLLDDKEVFVTARTNSKSNPLTEELSAEIQEVFSRYGCVRAVSGPASFIDPKIVKRSTMTPSLFIIGRGMEGSDTEFDLCTDPNSGSVHECYEGEDIDVKHGSYASIYHWIIATATESKQTGTRNS